MVSLMNGQTKQLLQHLSEGHISLKDFPNSGQNVLHSTSLPWPRLFVMTDACNIWSFSAKVFVLDEGVAMEISFCFMNKG